MAFISVCKRKPWAVLMSRVRGPIYALGAELNLKEVALPLNELIQDLHFDAGVTVDALDMQYEGFD